MEDGYDYNHLQCPPYSVTFHLPLHRHLSYILWQGVDLDDDIIAKDYLNEIENFSQDEQFLRFCMQHLIRIHVFFKSKFKSKEYNLNLYYIS